MQARRSRSRNYRKCLPDTGIFTLPGLIEGAQINSIPGVASCLQPVSKIGNTRLKCDDRMSMAHRHAQATATQNHAHTKKESRWIYTYRERE
jgi:hypothetical protein